MNQYLWGLVITGSFSFASLVATLLINKRVRSVDVKVDRYHEEVDGMKDDLVEAVRGRAMSEGNQQGRIEQTAEREKERNGNNHD